MRAENRGLLTQQQAQKQAVTRLKNETLETKRQCQAQMAELEGQMQDLMFFLKAQQEVWFTPRGGKADFLLKKQTAYDLYLSVALDFHVEVLTSFIHVAVQV